MVKLFRKIELEGWLERRDLVFTQPHRHVVDDAAAVDAQSAACESDVPDDAPNVLHDPPVPDANEIALPKFRIQSFQNSKEPHLRNTTQDKVDGVEAAANTPAASLAKLVNSNLVQDLEEIRFALGRPKRRDILFNHFTHGVGRVGPL